jgi:hypothetical protein
MKGTFTTIQKQHRSYTVHSLLSYTCNSCRDNQIRIASAVLYTFPTFLRPDPSTTLQQFNFIFFCSSFSISLSLTSTAKFHYLSRLLNNGHSNYCFLLMPTLSPQHLFSPATCTTVFQLHTYSKTLRSLLSGTLLNKYF